MSVSPRPSAPRPTPAASLEPTGSPALFVALATLFAVVGVALLAFLDYHLNQRSHVVVKLVLGGGLVAGLFLMPRLGLLALPILTPFLSWLPRVPAPGVNTLNIVLGIVFFAWVLQRVLTRRSVLRPNRLGGVLALILFVAGLSVIRGWAFPTGYDYDPKQAALDLFRAMMTFLLYYVGLLMARGPGDRRKLTWAIVIGLVAEAACTIVLGRNGRGARATGSFGQSNDLGAYLAMFTAFTLALIPGVRSWIGRTLLTLACLAGAAALVFSVSRGAVLALALGTAYVAWKSSRVLLFVLIAILVSSPLWAPDFLVQRFTGTQVEVEGTDATQLEGSAQTRVDTWRAIGKLVSEHPVEGVGFTGLADVLPQTGEAMGVEVKDSAHNTYLRFLAEMGVFGLLLFVLLLVRCWRLAQDGLRAAQSRFDRQLAIGLAGATIALIVNCAFGDRFFNVLITGNYWLACAVVNDLVISNPPAPAKRRGARAREAAPAAAALPGGAG